MPMPMPMPTDAQGHTVSATGSSKKIAKNLAAKLMLDKLEEVEGQSRLVQNSKNRVINVNTNYVKSPVALDTYPASKDALANQDGTANQRSSKPTRFQGSWRDPSA